MLVEVDRVSKAFGRRLALDGVSLEIRRGEVVALLGHNGAGKSTLFSLMLGLQRMTGGDVRIRGISVRRHGRRARQGVGSVLAPAFYEYLSGWDNLRALASYSGPVSDAEIAAAVGLVDLEPRIHERVRRYSNGMRRRLALAQALLPRPDLLLLDEWESGLDPAGRDAVRALLRRLSREHGTTVMLSSHHLAGLEGLADRLAILRTGRLAFLGDWSAVDAEQRLRLRLDDWARARPVLQAHGAEVRANGTIVLAPGADIADLVATLAGAGLRIRAVEPLRPALEELYLQAPAADGDDDPAGRNAPPGGRAPR